MISYLRVLGLDQASGLPVGDVVYLDILGQPMVVVNSFEAALTILESRSANTSDRPQSPMAEL